MVKCYNCGNNFDYETYYGICPKCGSYHREELPEPEPEFQKPTQQKSAASAILVLIALIFGLVAALAVPIGFGTYQIVKWAGIRSHTSYEMKTKKIPQNPEMIEIQPGETFTAGVKTQCRITVEKAYISRAGDHISGIPQGEALAAVKVSYQRDSDDGRNESSYDFTGEPYIKFEDQFRIALGDYELGDYDELFLSDEILDSWDMVYQEEGEGIFLFLVPEGTEQLCFYMDSRNEVTNDIQAIYEIPLKIEAGEEI